MLLAVDVGNTQTVLGLFSTEGVLSHTWRVATNPIRTADESAVLWRELLFLRRLPVDAATTAVIGSVVPPVGATWQEALSRAFALPVLQASVEDEYGLELEVEAPREVGVDRVANAIAARDLWGAPAIVVDLGTAITFDVVSREGRYVGGAIAPGVWTSAEALVRKAARLPRVNLVAPTRALGKDTVSAMQSGIVFGMAGMVDALVGRLWKELGPGKAPYVLATGGEASLIASASTSVQEVVPELTLLGLAAMAGQAGRVPWQVRR